MADTESDLDKLDIGSESLTAAVDEAFLKTGVGGRRTGMLNAFQGLKHSTRGSISAPGNRDSSGYVFFTKPLLNLTYDNIKIIRKLVYLGDPNTKSAGCAIRCLLSPAGASIGGSPIPSDKSSLGKLRSEMVDDANPFITLLSNTCISLSGWPDLSLDTFVSPEGLAKQVTAQVDGRADQYGSYDLTANFRNVRGDPVTALISAWVEYMGRVCVGQIMPYMELLIDNEIDYQTRIYRIITDETDRFVQKIYACNGAFPTAVPTAVAANYTSNTAYTDANAQVSIPFKAVGFMDNDPILIDEFNNLVKGFNSNMVTRDTTMVGLTGKYLKYKQLFDYKAYPYIEKTNELVWYVDKSLFEQVVGKV